MAFSPTIRGRLTFRSSTLVTRPTSLDDSLDDASVVSNNDYSSSGSFNDGTFDPLIQLDPLIVSHAAEDAVSAVLEASNQAAAEALSKDDDLSLEYTTQQQLLPTPFPTAPSVGKILKFAIPAIGVWLCSPILSLIDTSAVGLLSGTTQQAALNPAVAITDYSALLIAFLYTGTTNLIAAAKEQDRLATGRNQYI